MWGTIVNVLAILVGATMGQIAGKKLSSDLQLIVMQSIGLGVVLIGLQMAFQTQNVLITLISLVLGGLLGVILGLAEGLEKLGCWLENRLSKETSPGHFSRGFVSASLLYCVGAMAIMGSLESGLTGNHQILYAKSLLDGVSAIVLASTLGWGVAFSSLTVFVYQGSITLLASWVGKFLTEAIINEMTAVGGLMILAIGLGLLDIKEIKVANLLPAIIVVFLLTAVLGGSLF
ncbi:MAG: DUF554 domain-containing protein [Bacillota bacterium]|jgi:uncharacterized membrane protein YqgA involved in biofilm formation